MMKRHWLAPRKDGSWDVIDSEAVADAYRNEGRVKVEGPFVPAEQLEGAVDALREAWLGEKSGRRYALHGPTHNCTPDVCQIGQCPAIRALLGGGR
jgi:hypothetical protein